MNQSPQNIVVVDDSTTAEKLTVALAGFGFACAAFSFSAVVLLPLTGQGATLLQIPDGITATLILAELFGLPVVAGIAGVAVTARRARSLY